MMWCVGWGQAGRQILLDVQGAVLALVVRQYNTNLSLGWGQARRQAVGWGSSEKVTNGLGHL